MRGTKGGLSGAGEMAWLVNCLPSKDDGLSLMSSIHIKKPELEQQCRPNNLSAGEAETEEHVR